MAKKTRPTNTRAKAQRALPPAMGEQSMQQAPTIPGMPGVLSPFIGGMNYFATSAGTFINPQSGTSAQWASELMADPYAFGKWVGQWFWGTYNTYRLIVAHPRIRQARATLTNPIVASPYDYIARDGTPQNLVDLVKEQINPIRRQYVEDAIRALDYGWAPFEPCWEVRQWRGKPRNWLYKLKPLLPDITTIRVDGNGNFTGLALGATEVAALQVDQFKALIYTFDRECGNHYGRPLAENCRQTGWRMWLDAALQLHGVGEKLAHVIAMGFAPSVICKDPKTGQETNPVEEMQKALARLKETNIAVFANLVAMAKPGADQKQLAEASMAALSSVEFYDAGNHSAAITGELERMQHAEDLMFAGYLLSSRTGMQSRHGSRADAQEHSDTGLVSSDLIAGDIADQLQPMIDAICVLNGGEQYRGAIRAKPAPVVDHKSQLYGTILEAGLKDPTVGPALAGEMKWEAVCEQLDIPVREGGDFGEAVRTALATRQQQQQDAADAAKAGHSGGANRPQRVTMKRLDRPEKVGTMLSRWVSGDGLALSSRPMKEDTTGHWVTMDGTHVFIKDGVVTHGPAHLKGKRLDELNGARRAALNEHPNSPVLGGTIYPGDKYPPGTENRKPLIKAWHQSPEGQDQYRRMTEAAAADYEVKRATEKWRLRKVVAEMKAADPIEQKRKLAQAELRKAGFKLERSKGGSQYYRRGEEVVRLSDHEVPWTEERGYNAENGGFSWAMDGTQIILTHHDVDEQIKRAVAKPK